MSNIYGRVQVTQAMRIYSYRTRTRAGVWLWNPIAQVVALGLLACVGVSRLVPVELPLWPTLGVLIFVSGWFSQISVDLRRPESVDLSKSFLFIPYWWHRGGIASLTTMKDDDFMGGPDDVITGDGWELPCSRPERVVEWIRDAAAGFELARAAVVDRSRDEPLG